MTRYLDFAEMPDIPEPDYEVDFDDKSPSQSKCDFAKLEKKDDISAVSMFIPHDPLRRELHRELLHNVKIGRDVLQKSELQRVLERRDMEKRQREWHQRQLAEAASRNSLMEKLAKRAEKLTLLELEQTSGARTELEEIHQRIQRKSRLLEK